MLDELHQPIPKLLNTFTELYHTFLLVRIKRSVARSARTYSFPVLPSCKPSAIMTSCISSAISSTVNVAVLLASILASEGRYARISASVILCQIGKNTRSSVTAKYSSVLSSNVVQSLPKNRFESTKIPKRLALIPRFNAAAKSSPILSSNSSYQTRSPLLKQQRQRSRYLVLVF